ncbi:TIGR02757 family protein [Prevotella sp. A2931]|uniref:TIGR02757 family protein n=1 Tax=Prevotella illustrans TaxID=2800387 RepID=A0ABS3M6D5_9BACT|nr:MULTISPECIES: TIGR02757 family protein [Prevotella]MBO1363728.1 TIGR02757 family protein [Prevotella illustrans]PTL25301.1 TIGR02757 family protein [Prevotella sp. oral taxon 820]
MDSKLKKQLTVYAEHYETSDFLPGDPSWFMHRAEGGDNQETTAFIASCLSYGNRKLFMPKIQQLFDMAKGNLYQWISNGEYQVNIPDSDVTFYRLQTYHHIHRLFDGLHSLFQTHRTLGAFLQAKGVTTAMEAIEVITQYFASWDVGHLIPHTAASSCKRICMFLRWMVRDHSPVDLGLWPFIDKRTLLMPLDTHVLQEAIRLNLIRNKSTTMKTVIALTKELKKFFPDDPLKGDFALFGYGMQQTKQTQGHDG